MPLGKDLFLAEKVGTHPGATSEGVRDNARAHARTGERACARMYVHTWPARRDVKVVPKKAKRRKKREKERGAGRLALARVNVRFPASRKTRREGRGNAIINRYRRHFASWYIISARNISLNISFRIAPISRIASIHRVKLITMTAIADMVNAINNQRNLYGNRNCRLIINVRAPI